MTSRNLQAVIRHLRAVGADPASDRELLERFARQRDEAAFAELVHRHGGLVLGVCERLLGNHHDAEDAFQATFLVLARKAGGGRWQDSIDRWLYRVAYHMAKKTQQAIARQRAAIQKGASAAGPRQPADVGLREVSALLDEGLNALSARYREVLMVCCLEGQAREDAAQRLGLSQRTLERRLARGKRLLGGWLARRGVTMSAALLAAELSKEASAQQLAPAAVSSTARAATEFLKWHGGAREAISERAAAMAETGVRRLGTVKAATLALTLTAGVCAAGWLARGRLMKDALAGAAPAPPVASATAEHRPAEQARTDVVGDPLPEGAIARIGTTRFRHGGGEVVALSPTRDGKLLISCNFYGDPEVCVWQLPSGRPKYRLPGNVEFVQFAVSPDDKLLAIPRGKEIHLWDLSTGRELRHWIAYDETAEYTFPPITSAAFSPDGQTLASAGMDRQIRFWDTKTWRERRRLATGLPKGVPPELVAFSTDGKLLACAARLYQRVTLWELASGGQMRQLGGNGTTWSLAFSPDSQQLVTGGRGAIAVWDARAGRRSEDLKASDSGFLGAVAFAPSGDLLAAAQGKRMESRGNILLFDTNTGRELRRIDGVPGGVDSLTFLPNGKTLASGGKDGIVRLWDVARGKEILHGAANQGSVNSIGLSASGNVLFSAGRRDSLTVAGTDVLLSDARTGQELARLGGNAPMALSADRRLLACWGDGGTVTLWDTRTRAVAKSLPGRQLARGEFIMVTALSFAANGQALAVGIMDYSKNGPQVAIQVWDVGLAKEVRRIPWKYGLVDLLVLTPDGAMVVAAGSGDTGVNVRIWDAATGKELRKLADRVTFGMRAMRPEPQKGPPVPRLGGPRLSLSPNGQLLAIAVGTQPDVTLWEMLSGKQRLQLKGHSHTPMCVEFSGDGRLIATAAWDNTVRVWDALTGQEHHRFTGHHGIVNGMAFSADRRRLATGGNDCTCLVWDIGSSQQPEAGPRTSLSKENCQRFWFDLGDPDASKAQRAIARMVEGGETTVAFLTERLRPPSALDEPLVKRLLSDLESSQFATRERATQELRRLGEDVIPLLRQTTSGQQRSAEFTSRVGDLIETLALPSDERLREYRAVEVLEYIGSRSALALLKTIGEGTATSRVAHAAAASAERLAKRINAAP